MPRGSPRVDRSLAAIVLTLYLPFALDGCVSIRLAPGSGHEVRDALTGTFRFLAVRKARDRGNTEAACPAVTAALWRISKGEEQVVWRETGGDWTARDLPPGRYLLRVERVIDANGEAEEPRGELEEEVTIHGGETARADVVLQKTPWGLIVALSATVVLVVVALVVLSDLGDVDLPDGADLAALVPPLPPLSPEAVVVGLEFAELLSEEMASRRDPDRGATILGVSPEDGAAGVPASTVVDVELSDPVDPETVDQRTFGLFADRRQIPAAIAVREEGRRLHLVPLQPLPEGDVRARFLGTHVRVQEGAGATLDGNYTWRFSVAATPAALPTDARRRVPTGQRDPRAPR